MKRLPILKFIIIFNIYLICCANVLAKAIFIDSSYPPPGFESTQIKQYLRVSVFFMHQHIGYFYIDLYQGKLKFRSPEHLLSQLEGVKKNKTVLRLLKQSFPLNIECYPNEIAALSYFCTELNKKSIYIIYNPQQETVYLFLSSSHFQKPKEETALDFISNSTSDWSYINKLGAAGSFSTNDHFIASRIYSSIPNYYNFYSNNILAYRNSSLIGNISQNNGINNGANFQIQNLYAQHIVQDKIYTGGYIINPTSPFFQTQTIVGVGVKTTLETARNIENIIASPLVIFVPQASQVSIFRNEQLIFSQYLEPGYQRINTSNFPDGGYDLTIKIGSNNIIHQFFTKGLFLPPEQAPQFYAVGGYLTNGMILNDNSYNFLPKVLNIPVIQAGLTTRIHQQMALLSDVMLNAHQALFDFGPIFFWGSSFVKIAGLLATKNNYGMYAMLNTQKNKFNINLILTKIFYQKTKPEYFFLNNLVDNDSISVSYQLSDYSLLGIQANYNKSLKQPVSYSAGTFYQREIGNYRGMRFFINAAYNNANYIGNTYILSINMNFGQDRLAGTESLSWQNQNKNSRDNQLALPVVVQGSTVYSQQNEQGIGYAVNEIHTLSPTVSSLAGIYNYTALKSFVATYMNYNRIKGEGRTLGFGGNIETELVMTRQATLMNGINRGNTSGIIAEVKSSTTVDKSAKFALLDAYNRKIAILPINKKVFVSLPQFSDQNYTLINFSRAAYFIKTPVRHISLYPGNIGYYVWLAEKRIIIIGRAIMKQKNYPLANTWIHAGRDGIFSDAEGNFQLELPHNTTVLEASNGCRIKLPKLNVNKVYLYIGDVMCS